MKRPTADVQQLSLDEEDPHEQQEGSSSLDQEDSEPLHIKEEQEELWSSQEGTEETDIKFPFTLVTVKSEDDEEEAQSSQLHHRHTEEMETGADGEDCGGAEPERDSDPQRPLYPEIEVKVEDSSDAETDVSDDWKESRGHTSGFKSVDNMNNKRTKTHSCSECGKRFKRKWNLTTHMKNHTELKPFSCSECGKKFSRKGSLSRHMILHTGEKPFSCSICIKRFNQKHILTLHMAHHRGEKPLSCRICDQRFSWPFQLQRHMRVGCQASEPHEDQTELNREDCGGPEQDRSSDPERHVQTQTEVKTEGDSSGPETEVCQNVKDTQVFQSSLNSVDRIQDNGQCTDEKPNSFSLCAKPLTTKTNVFIHMTAHKRGTLISCSECGKIFTQKSSLNRHTMSHRGEKPFVCSECGKSFSRKSYLTSHMGSHGEEKLFSCSECGRRFNYRGSLTAHMMIHRGEKPFSCSECGKRFNSKANMTRHMRIHTGEKPFSCSVCIKTFKQKSHLTIHMAHHREEKPFSCTVCDKRFMWTFQLKRHKCVGGPASEPHEDYSELNREAETGADGEDCGGPEQDGNSALEGHEHPEIEVKIEESSEPESEDSHDNWKESRDHESAVNKDKRKTVKKSHSCSLCGKLFIRKGHLMSHIKIHTRGRPFSFFPCSKSLSCAFSV